MSVGIRRLIFVSAILAVSPFSAFASKVNLDISMANGILPADQKQTTYLKVGLTGFDLPSADDRAPINIAIVLDKSGSMSGKKIDQAKEAAIAAINRLQSDDIVSVVSYAGGVEVIVPATKLTDKESVTQAIQSINAGGSTALFAGVSKGAAEVRKFLDSKRVNRVILLSDGRANVGPNAPSELGDLGESLQKEGISVSTMGLGLGYNEDLMVKLAETSNGNHMFIEEADELIAIFNAEFNDVLSVVAQEVSLKIKLSDGVRAVRTLGRDAEIIGQDVFVSINQLYSKQEKYVMLEVELPSKPDDSQMHVASVGLTYANMQTHETDELSGSVDVKFSKDQLACSKSINVSVTEQCVLQIANETNVRATLLRDQGKTEEARQLLRGNYAYLNENATILGSDLLQLRCADNKEQAENIDKDWVKFRKDMRAKQIEDSQQQLRGTRR
jgi:Ca-activated chloride channel family protein